MEKPSVRTVDRLVEILNCFSLDEASWSLSELAGRLGLPKSTLHRFVVGLEGHGILRRGADDGRWRLGRQLFIWGTLAVESTGLRLVAAPVMRELADRTGETVLLTEYHDGVVVCIDKVETSHSVRLATEIGAVRPPHAGASSKVLMAFLPEAEVQTIIHERGLPRLCARTITDPALLREELGRIRARGYADSYEETDIGAWGIATPIRDWRGAVVAALGIAGPTVRFSEPQAEEYVSLCCDAAGRISALLGANSSPHSLATRSLPSTEQPARRGEQPASSGIAERPTHQPTGVLIR